IQPGRIDDHAVWRKVELAIIDDADLAANRLAVILEAEQTQHVARPRATRDDEGVGCQRFQMTLLGFAGTVLSHHAHESGVGHRSVGMPRIDPDTIAAVVDCIDVNAVAKLRAQLLGAIAIVILQQVRIDEAVAWRERRALDAFEAIDLRHPLMDLIRSQLLNRMAEAALQIDMRECLGPSLGIVEPEVTLLAETDLARDALVVLNRSATQSDVDGFPPRRAHTAGVLLAGAEPPRQIDIDGKGAL